MSLTTHKTLGRLIEAAEEQIEQIDTVSLDVFDTLFIRRIEDPDIIKIPMGRYIADLAEKEGINISWIEVDALRSKIEQAHRDKNGQTYPDFEANYDQFIPELLETVFKDKLPQGLFEKVIKRELALENAMLVPRAEIVEWIKSLHARGKRLFLISDMYLPAKYISELVADKNLDSYFEAVISSADSFNAKASGTAYPLVEQRFNLDKTRWLHVGDNPISDGVRADEFGLKALVIEDPAEQHRKKLAKTYNHYSTRNTFWKGRNVLQLMLPLEAENIDRDELYLQGFNQFGFVFAYFIQRLAERSKQLKLKRIYFCAREGWFLMKCWERFAPWFFPDGDAPEIKYLYVSRMALANAMIANTGLTSVSAEVALLPPGNTTFKDVCRVFGLNAEDYAEDLQRYHLDADEIISNLHPDLGPDARRNFGLFLLDSKFQSKVKRAGEQSSKALVNYLQSEGFFEHPDIGLVDVGWLGTIHNNLYQAISHVETDVNVHGFLMCATRYIDYPFTESRSLQGLVYDRHRFEVGTSLLQYVKDIMEEICRAPDMSLLAYQAHPEKGFELKFRTDKDESAKLEQAQSEYYLPLQQGILDSIEAYAKATAVLGYHSGEFKPWLNFNLFKSVACAKTADILRVRPSAHQDDFGNQDTRVKRKTFNKNQELWQRSKFELNLWPNLRMRTFKKHCLGMLR